jgi:hypothetical protein
LGRFVTAPGQFDMTVDTRDATRELLDWTPAPPG